MKIREKNALDIKFQIVWSRILLDSFIFLRFYNSKWDRMCTGRYVM